MEEFQELTKSRGIATSPPAKTMLALTKCAHLGERSGNSHCGAARYHCNLHNTPCVTVGGCTGNDRRCQTCNDNTERANAEHLPNSTEHRTPNAKRVLFIFPHGLGDCVQFGSVLRHIQSQRKDWLVDVRVHAGRDRMLRGFANSVETTTVPVENGYDVVFRDDFLELDYYTKTIKELMLKHLMRPEPDLIRYRLTTDESDHNLAISYLMSLSGPAIVAHYKGHSMPNKKNLRDVELLPVADECLRRGMNLVVLDFDYLTSEPIKGHPAVKLLRDPEFMDGARLCALLSRAHRWIGIDSGPGHVGGATDTPGVVVWTHHHPRRFYDPCPNVLHLVPTSLDFLPPYAAYRKAWESQNRHRVYNNLGEDLKAAIFEGYHG